MKQLISYIKQSVYGPEYYRELLVRPLSYSWKYYSGLAMLIAIFLTIISSILLVPQVNRAINEFPAKFFAYYPNELELRVQNGVVTSNVVEPYFLPIPEMYKKVISQKGDIEHLVVIDTKTPISLDAFRAYKSVIWVGGNAFVFYDNQLGIRIAPITKNANYVVNESTLHGIESRLSPYYVFFAPLMVLAIFLALMVGLGVNFIYLLFGALLVMLLGRFILKQKWGYGTAYRIGLHAITLPLLVDTLLSFVGLNIINIPLLQTVLLLAVVYLNYKDMKPVKTNPAPMPTESTLSEK